MFRFILGYDGGDSFVLPLAPESFTTKVGNKNRTIELVTMGETNILKTIGLRDFSFKVLLSKDREFSGLGENEFHEPIFYLSKFRDMKAACKPVRFRIERIMPDGSVSFPGNLLVSFEDYTVQENAQEEGDYWVELKLKEYREINAVVTKLTGNVNEDGRAEAVRTVERSVREPPEEYTIKAGDSLWKIAQLLLGDGSKYGEIAELNGIADPSNLAGMEGKVLKIRS